jgi:hypothetical protein
VAPDAEEGTAIRDKLRRISSTTRHTATQLLDGLPVPSVQPSLPFRTFKQWNWLILMSDRLQETRSRKSSYCSTNPSASNKISAWKEPDE